MRLMLGSSAWLLLLLSSNHYFDACAFSPSAASAPARTIAASRPLRVSALAQDIARELLSATDTTPPSSTPRLDAEELTARAISQLAWRQLHAELSHRHLDTTGSTAVLRARLKQAVVPGWTDRATNPGDDAECVLPNTLDLERMQVEFVDASNPFETLLEEIIADANQLHWKRATRRLKRLERMQVGSSDEDDDDALCIPPQVYEKVLSACMADRLHGARAAEATRKIMEKMAELGYSNVAPDQLNFALRNTLSGPDGFGGMDTALAMLSAIGHMEEQTQADLVTAETYAALTEALAREGSVEPALQLLRRVVVEQRETPPLSAFSAVAFAELKFAGKDVDVEDPLDFTKGVGPERVFTVLAYAKAAGYELETIASTEDGRKLLTAGLLAADQLKQTRLGLRLLKAASQAQGVAPDRGDVLIALSAVRAAGRLHARAITEATKQGEWQLAVKLLQVMMGRGLKPNANLWRTVVTACAKQEKSRKATAVLLDWVKLHEQGKAEKPPISVFNTVVNSCEICGEEELTIPVLEAMKRTHETDGNIITFNIALKRLARRGNVWAPEGIIIGMIENGVEPSVVTYTTAIAACAAANPKDPARAYEWMRRMRSRNVQPNIVTYNTALAACLDDQLSSTELACTMAKELLTDVQRQLALTALPKEAGGGGEELVTNPYTTVIPDYSTRAIATKLMKQLKANWVAGDIDKQQAKATLRVPLLELVNFSKSKAAEEVQAKAAQVVPQEDSTTVQAEAELEYLEASKVHRSAEV